MERTQWESAALSYPQQYVQGLYAIPAGVTWFMIGFSNLGQQPLSYWMLASGLLLCLGLWLGITRYYQNNYGRVTPTKSTRMRSGVAIVISFAVFVGADQLLRIMFGRPPDRSISSYTSSWALAMLVFFVITTGLKLHHIVIWSSLLIAGLLPIWGLGLDRDAIASFPIGVALILSGLLDHRLLVRDLNITRSLYLDNSNAGL